MFFNALPGLKADLEQISREMECVLPAEWREGPVGEVIQAILEGRGKGYRPSLLFLVGQIGPNYPACKERLYRLGALVELVHMASLIHDDIIDDSALRRGNPTIQARFGKEMAVYAGDLLLGHVMSVLMENDMTKFGLLISKTVEDMCRGELGQLACRYRTDLSQEDYYKNIYGKTASMFVTVCKIGGMESGCSQEVIDRLEEIGLHLGYLFQIRDDLLDFSHQKVTDGKLAHVDFQEGIFTLPVIYAMKQEEYKDRLEELAWLAKTGSLTESHLAELERLIVSAGGFTAAVQKAEHHRAVIEEGLGRLPSCPAVKTISYLVSKLELPNP